MKKIYVVARVCYEDPEFDDDTCKMHILKEFDNMLEALKFKEECKKSSCSINDDYIIRSIHLNEKH